MNFGHYIHRGLLIFLGIGALPSGIMLVLRPDGSLFGMPLSMLDGSPFTDFVIPGLVLGSVLGAWSLVLAVLLWRRIKLQGFDKLLPFGWAYWPVWRLALLQGVVVFVWLGVQIAVIRSLSWLHIVYAVVAVGLIGTALLPSVRRRYQYLAATH